MTQRDQTQYSKKEAKKRFETALRGGLSTPPKPLKPTPKKRIKANSSKSG